MKYKIIEEYKTKLDEITIKKIEEHIVKYRSVDFLKDLVQTCDKMCYTYAKGMSMDIHFNKLLRDPNEIFETVKEWFPRMKFSMDNYKKVYDTYDYVISSVAEMLMEKM